MLAERGAHRDAAVEFGTLARNDPRQVAWAVAEAAERLDAEEAARGIEAARRAARLDPSNGLTQLGDASGALAAANRAVELAPRDPANREALADALWLTGREGSAFNEFRALLPRLAGVERARVVAKASALYRRRSGLLGRLLTSWPALFAFALRSGWIDVR